MNPNATPSNARGRQRGFSLIEIMVGVMVGLIGCVVIFQMYAAAETRKRSVASGSDMDISGRLGLMTLERDLQLAGYGITAMVSDSLGAVLNCNVAAYDALRPTPDFSFPLLPVVIQQGAGGTPDTIATLRGNSSLLVGPKIIDASTATTKRVKVDTSGGRTGMLVGDVVIATRWDAATATASCGMAQITSVANPDQLTLDHNGGRYNKGGGVAFNLVDEGHLYSMGPAPVRSVWSVQGNKLRVYNDLAYTGGTPGEAADLIVNLQAQYGVDANANGMVEPAEWTEAAPADWKQLLAVRFALLARSTQYEPVKVTTAVPRWSAIDPGTGKPTLFVMTNVDGTADSDPGDPAKGDVNNWRNYRYNVFEAVVPLRNALIGRQL
jgi:type IV pilus assembly protein PilW